MRPTPQQIREIFEACLDADTLERTNILENVATQNQLLAKEVSTLLTAHDSIFESKNRSGDPLEKIIANAAAAESKQRKQSDPLDEMPAGHRVGDFIIIRKLGSGAFAHVYLATQLSLSRNVALKVSRVNTPEATMMAQLAHKNIVQVHSVMPVAAIDAEAICMQYVPGIALDQLIALLEAKYAADTASWSGADILSLIELSLGDPGISLYKNDESRKAFAALNSADAVLQITICIARALEHAHKHDILHLDVKPSNILININGDALLMDFNVSFHRHTFDGQVLGGTPEFMAPEHSLALITSRDGATGTYASTNIEIDERSDVFSLGMVGKRLLRLLPNTNESNGFRDILIRSTCESPSERFQSAVEFEQACNDVRRVASLERSLSQSQNNFLYRLGRKHPKTSIVTVLIVPNAIASIIQISYNQIHIIGNLSAFQKSLFTGILLPWNLLVYGLACVMIWNFFKPFFLRTAPGAAQICSVGERTEIRRTLVRTPFLTAALVAVEWSVSCTMFLIALSYFSGPLSFSVGMHLVISFLMAMAIPLTFNLLGLGYLNAVAFYPSFLRGISHTAKVAKSETKTLRATMKALRLVAGAVPLAGAIIGVAQGPGSDPASEYPYRAMVSAFILTGIFGTWFAVTLVDSFTAAMKEIDTALD